eukprot:GEZU01025752.1.p1 GENE.GEZU01025752.1~~GEZU01025752.1.p1  ORF type:complete len:385 (-),score=43.19 GEZU01025752.1:400-1554(-)
MSVNNSDVPTRVASSRSTLKVDHFFEYDNRKSDQVSAPLLTAREGFNSSGRPVSRSYSFASLQSTDSPDAFVSPDVLDVLTAYEKHYDDQIQRRERLSVAIVFIIIWMILDIIMPLYNKLIYAGFGNAQQGFTYPLTVTEIQLLGTALLLLIYNWIEHIYYKKTFGAHRYWVFGPNFWLKIKETILPSLMFAAVLGLGNVGLSKIGANIHVLLKSSSMIWLLIFAFMFRSERPHIIAILLALIVTTGVTLLSINSVSDNRANWFPVLINLLSAVFTGLNIITIRMACERTKKPPLRMSVLEITAFKMTLTFLILLVPTILCETVFAEKLLHQPNVWTAFSHTDVAMILVILGGIVMTGLFQTCVVAITAHLKALSFGIIQEATL